MDLVDYFGGGFIIYVLVIVETVGINYIYGNIFIFSEFLYDYIYDKFVIYTIFVVIYENVDF